LRSDTIQLPDNAVLTPLPIDEDISSLSAILLDDDYSTFLRSGKVVIDGVTVLGPAYLIPFKAKAWLDLSMRKKMGEPVDSKNIRKRKNDVHEFIERMKEETVDLKQLGIVGRQKEDILNELSEIYR
jgi:hypothetical protein